MIKRLRAIIAACLAVLPFGPSSTAQDTGFNGEQVVILHGLARSAAHMTSLSAFLESHGYRVFNLEYPSTQHSLETLTAMVATDIRNQVDPSRPLHFVGYSLGGLITRAVLNKYRPDNLGRVVQLAVPNRGSQVADVLKDLWLFKVIYGPAGQQLVTEGANIEELLGEVNYDLGVLAGNFSVDPVSSLVIPGDDDGRVSVENTKIAGMQDHLVIGASHHFFPQNETVQQQTLHFLRTGTFRH